VRVHVFQHVPFEGLGSIGAWLDERGARVSRTRFFAGDRLPPVDGVDMLVAMGGPMSVNDEAEFPWLRAEKQVIREAIARQIPVLGVCLGAQLVADALGARVYPNAVKEIGWFPIEGVAAPTSVFAFPPECLAFHWHGETFDLPEGAVRLARSEACENQAFQWKRNVIALQFHLETTAESLRALVENCRAELAAAAYVQSEQELLATPAARYRAVNTLMHEVLAYLTGP
jgi:GMP synthase-like glutamine amidotransferase